MNYYKRHLGDYAKHTSHLTVVEHGLYNLFLDWYYVNEKPIPPDLIGRLARGYEAEARAVLMEFFTLSDDGWRSSRADEEIREYHKKAKQNQEVGKLGGRPRKTETVPSGNPDETQTVSRNNPDVTQTISHKPLAIKELKPRSAVRQAAPDVEFEFAWALYPKRGGGNSKADALKAWIARRRDGESVEVMTAGADRYAQFIRATGKERTEFVMQGARFFGPSRQYLDDWSPPATPPPPPRAMPRDMQALMNLEEAKNGLVRNGSDHGPSEAFLLEAPRFALGGNGARDRRGVD